MTIAAILQNKGHEVLTVAADTPVREAVAIVAAGDSGFHIHMLIATALGVGLTVLLGTGLMALSFLSARSGHDAQAHHHDKDQA